MLRNAFEAIATESSLGKVVQLLGNIQRAVTWARDTQDRMIVNVAQTPNSVQNNGSSTNTMQGAALNPAHWGSLSWNTVDDRWSYGNGLNGVFNSTRSRWTIT